MTGPGRAHGTHACYVWGPAPGAGKGCRCEPCRAAHSVYERERAARVAPPFVDATEARSHVEGLVASGVGLKQIARVSGISTGVLSKLIYGQPSRGKPPTRRIRPATRDALLAVKGTDHADGAPIPAGPTWENIRILLSRGWTKTAIARGIGQQGPGLQLGSRTVTAGRARAVAALLDQPVPPRRSRHGIHPVPLPDPEKERVNKLRRAAEAERRAEYRARAAAAEAIEQGEDPYELPVLFGAAGDWMRRGACRSDRVPTWMFFPAPSDAATIEAAKKVCACCPVTEACEAAGYGQDGIWGGYTEAERAERRALEVAS